MHAIANPADFEFQQEKVLSLAEQQVGDITVRTMVNSRTLEIAITYLRASFHRRSVNLEPLPLPTGLELMFFLFWSVNENF